MGESYPEYGESYSFDQNSDPFGGMEPKTLSSDDRARIIFMGTRRSGKSSIQKVVFYKMSPHEVWFLEPTAELEIIDISTSALVQFQLLDFPGNFDFEDQKSQTKYTPGAIFGKTGALVYVIDAQDDVTYNESIEYFSQVCKLAYKENPKLAIHVLIHKVDGDEYLSSDDDHKLDFQNDIKKNITDELAEQNLPMTVSFHLTSIYDHTIFEAFSSVVQGLIPQLPLLEKLMDGLISSCSMEKAFLFDVVSKIYVATDSNPHDMQTYELCSDMIDVVIDVSCIYGMKPGEVEQSRDVDAAAMITLSNQYVLYLREVNKYLALVCMMRQDSFTKVGLVEYNFAQFKQAITKLLMPASLRLEGKREGKTSDDAEEEENMDLSKLKGGNPAGPPRRTAKPGTGSIADPSASPTQS
eukprot:gb/GEZN01007589.1/.p1 GENE.gb/GEZN01007589.1/~~gb/GEZN01007589.1/.p1  ORF type:complete len:411 (+),score=68.38 gb/GEZN01007589.1/:52-1284(+)